MPQPPDSWFWENVVPIALSIVVFYGLYALLCAFSSGWQINQNRFLSSTDGLSRWIQWLLPIAWLALISGLPVAIWYTS